MKSYSQCSISDNFSMRCEHVFPKITRPALPLLLTVMQYVDLIMSMCVAEGYFSPYVKLIDYIFSYLSAGGE